MANNPQSTNKTITQRIIKDSREVPASRRRPEAKPPKQPSSK